MAIIARMLIGGRGATTNPGTLDSEGSVLALLLGIVGGAQPPTREFWIRWALRIRYLHHCQ
eukprot:10303309-Lingulodinium_polyedra.AAC.1